MNALNFYLKRKLEYDPKHQLCSQIDYIAGESPHVSGHISDQNWAQIMCLVIVPIHCVLLHIKHFWSWYLLNNLLNNLFLLQFNREIYFLRFIVNIKFLSFMMLVAVLIKQHNKLHTFYEISQN